MPGVQLLIMAMTVGTKKAARADINVTPLIDVLLVLLIIFMITTPTQQKGLEALVPQPADPAAPAPIVDRTITIEIGAGNAVSINSEPSDFERLGDRLIEIFKTRAERALYVKADPDIEFRHVAKAIDIAKGAGIQDIGLLGKSLPASK